MIGFTTGEEQATIKERYTQKSILELYPAYNFVVTSTFFNMKEILLKKYRTISVSICAVLAFVSINAFFAIGHWHPDGYIAFNVFAVFIFVATLSFVLTTRHLSKLKKLYSIAHYIQSFENCEIDKYEYAFIISSNRKWGLIRIRNLQIVIQPTFDFIEWEKPNEFIKVLFNNHREIRDINNHLCI